jgi:hypothetical protein
MTQTRCTQLEGILLDPAERFVDPNEVVADESLTREQKIRILKVWENDAAEAEVATEEGMPEITASRLRPVLLALRRVAGEASIRTDPSKQHVLL